jgi:hypothetical protein
MIFIYSIDSLLLFEYGARVAGVVAAKVVRVLLQYLPAKALVIAAAV